MINNLRANNKIGEKSASFAPKNPVKISDSSGGDSAANPNVG
jgi:hypothetical protein